MQTLVPVREVKRPPARWSTTLLVVFGPTLVALLINGWLVYIWHDSPSSLAFAYGYVLTTVAMQLMFVGIVAWLLKQEGSSLLRLINLDPAQLPKQLGIGVIVCLIRLAIALVYTTILSQFGVPQPKPLLLDGVPYLFALVIGAAAAGFCIEVIWRGYGITHLETLTKSTLWAVLISTLGSALWHLDLYTMVGSILGGLFFSWMYVKQRSLVSVIFAHWTRDVIGYLFQYLTFAKF